MRGLTPYENAPGDKLMKTKRTILLVEDDHVDAMTVERALKDVRVTNPLHIASDGEEALEYLKTNETPCLILLDLNMPRMNGIEFLQAVKADSVARRIPVVVLTTSEAEQDKIKSFDLCVAGYMIKPVDYKRFVDIVRTIDMYWTLSELPD
jgi:CheY-like chemotaxis protein